jgi:hypothetical protein
MPSAIVCRKRVDFVYDRSPNPAEYSIFVPSAGHENHLK